MGGGGYLPIGGNRRPQLRRKLAVAPLSQVSKARDLGHLAPGEAKRPALAKRVEKSRSLDCASLRSG
jgi:hypothetical protein